MHEPPDILNGAQVVCFTPLDERHAATGGTRHFRDGKQQTGFAGLVIARYPGQYGFYLFYCDQEWSVKNDTLHESLDDARAQAEFEFRGTSGTWTAKNIEPSTTPNGGPATSLGNSGATERPPSVS